MKFLLTVDEPVFPHHGRIAGLQVRVHEMAHALLAAGREVAVLGPEERVAGLPWPSYATTTKARSFAADAWICSPLLVRRHSDLLGSLPLVVDCYEAPIGSYLSYAASQPAHARRLARATFRREMAEYLWALAMADRALVANERQQASIASLLALFGRFDLLAPLEEQVLIVSSGAPPAPQPPPTPPDEERPLVLWAGGAYPWFALDQLPGTLRRITEDVPEVRFRFAGLHGRDGVLGSRQVLGQRFLDKVALDPALAGRIDHVVWAPYAQRVHQYDGVTVVISTHGQHVETYFSMRTRLLDVIWAGAPLVTSGGDELSERLRTEGAAVVSEDATLAQDVVTLLHDPVRRAAMTAASRALRDGPLAWRTTIGPLLTLSCGQPLERNSARGLAVLQGPGVRRRQVREKVEWLLHRLWMALHG